MITRIWNLFTHIGVEYKKINNNASKEKNILNLSKRGKNKLVNILVTQLLGKLDFGGTYQKQDKKYPSYAWRTASKWFNNWQF